MHDADGISLRSRVKKSTLLRSRVDFLIKYFCFFTVYLTGTLQTACRGIIFLNYEAFLTFAFPAVLSASLSIFSAKMA